MVGSLVQYEEGDMDPKIWVFCMDMLQFQPINLWKTELTLCPVPMSRFSSMEDLPWKHAVVDLKSRHGLGQR